MPVKVFISYSHKDEHHKEALAEHLTMLQRNGVISTWDDRQLVAGDDWKDQISANLEEAELILFLVSPSFLASSYCFDVEFARARAKHAEGSAILVPIFVRASDWKSSDLQAYQGLPKDAEPVAKWPDQDEAWMNVIDGLKKRLAIFATKKSTVVISADQKKKL